MELGASPERPVEAVVEVAPVVQPARQAAVELAASPERPVEAVVEVAPVVQPARQAAELAALPERPVEAAGEVGAGGAAGAAGSGGAGASGPGGALGAGGMAGSEGAAGGGTAGAAGTGGVAGAAGGAGGTAKTLSFATTPAATFTSGTVGISSASSFALGDIDGDGKIDLAILQPPTSSPGAINLAVFLNNGSGATGHFFATTPAATFTSGTVGISTTSSFALGDVDGDGKVDLAILQPPTSSPGAINLAVFLNNGSGATGHFFATTPAATFTSGTVGISTTSSFALGDVDGDGKVDLAILQAPNQQPGRHQPGRLPQQRQRRCRSISSPRLLPRPSRAAPSASAPPPRSHSVTSTATARSISRSCSPRLAARAPSICQCF